MYLHGFDEYSGSDYILLFMRGMEIVHGTRAASVATSTTVKASALQTLNESSCC